MPQLLHLTPLPRLPHSKLRLPPPAALGAAAGPVKPKDGIAMATAPRRATLLAALTAAKLGLCNTGAGLLNLD
jgi:hypothetical protein